MGRLPRWARWNATRPDYTVGIEEELMPLDPGRSWSLDQEFAAVREQLSGALADRLESETHAAAVEIATAPHRSAAAAGAELVVLRRRLADELAGEGRAAAGAGLHPATTWEETELSDEHRYEYVHETMRDLARREPTFATHVHVAIGDPERALDVANRMRAHLPLLLALSANSPYWQGRDTGLASARTPVFDAFPRTGIPRTFDGYGDFVETLETMVACGAFPEPSFIWWDLRLRPASGTIEIRAMDAQSDAERTASLAALTQVLVRLEDDGGFASDRLAGSHELLSENRFIAARDGVEAKLLDPDHNGRITVTELVDRVLERGQGAAHDLDCVAALARLPAMVAEPAHELQRELAGPEPDLSGLVAALSERFSRSP
jgi:carboxylate-amine ligase